MTVLAHPIRMDQCLYNGVGRGSHNGIRKAGYPLTFGSYSSAPLDTVVMSRTKQTLAAGAISITAGAGEYQINGGLWVATPGTVEVGDMVRARVTSSALYETAVTVEVTIDGVADVFSVTTLAEVTDTFTHYTDDEHYTDLTNYTD